MSKGRVCLAYSGTNSFKLVFNVEALPIGFVYIGTLHMFTR
jgi:hypothetical protein